jgi:aspartyl-tRNA(Asn)/glutamyl-tRNA(Gln) amidotransferase subunit A
VVAYGGAPLALGSDTGGSIRIPAAFCGVVGLKPTFGRASAAGVLPLAPSLDHIGPLARTPADALALLEVIQGSDPADPATARQGREPAAPERLRVAVCPDLHTMELEPAVRRGYEAAVAALGERAEIVEVGLPAAAEGILAFAAIQMPEALRVHRLAGVWPARAGEYGPDVRYRMRRAGDVTLDDHLAARESQRRLKAGFAAMFERADVLITPVSACAPARIGAYEGFRERVLAYTVPQDVAGLPACAVPVGTDGDGLPVGVQISGPWWSERRVAAVAGELLA